MRKRINKTITVMFLVLTLCFSMNAPAFASLTQTETNKKLSISGTSSTLKAYAAFDRFGSNMGNGKEWDYTGKASIVNAAKAGTLKLTIKGQATLNTSAGISVGGGSSISASTSSSWQTISSSYSQTKSIKKKTGTQSTSDTSNLIVAPRAHYQTNTACITVTAQIKWSNSSKWYKISALA